MVLGGFNGGDGDLDDVELVSLDPTSSQHVPDCLTQLNPLPVALLNAAGALDLNREYSPVLLMVPRLCPPKIEPIGGLNH